ncbi:uncharacterized protein LOC128993404 [Macrosteles quadrilineatus]|uniref:uncharacterized protein LOC128993404 n=1 Tax=Macrosteles quadrilineatus TaxID=74068 RepID=UPI0023E33F74|nr:uncharacterized protein LOC128993404 [Macrosteles quadrilineatus]
MKMIPALLFVLVFAGQNIPESAAAGKWWDAFSQPTNIRLMNEKIQSLRHGLEVHLGSNIGNDVEDKAKIGSVTQDFWNNNQNLVKQLVHNCVRREYMEASHWDTCDDIIRGLLDNLAIGESDIGTYRTLSGSSSATRTESGGKFQNLLMEKLESLIRTSFNNCQPDGVRTDTEFQN